MFGKEKECMIPSLDHIMLILIVIAYEIANS